MYLKFKIIITLLICISANSQNILKAVEIDPKFNPTSSDEFVMHYFNIDKVTDLTYLSYFRYIKNGLVINLFSDDNISFSGEVVNYITEQKHIKDKNGKNAITPGNYVYEIIKLDSATSNQIGKLILDSNVQAVPDSDDIKNWNTNFLHCETINL